MEGENVEHVVFSGLCVLGFNFNGYKNDVGYALTPQKLRRGDSRSMEHVVYFLAKSALGGSTWKRPGSGHKISKSISRKVLNDPFKDVWPITDASCARDFRRLLIQLLHSKETFGSDRYRTVVSMSLLQHPHGEKYLHFLSLLLIDALQLSKNFASCRHFPSNFEASLSSFRETLIVAFKRRCATESSIFLHKLVRLLQKRGSMSRQAILLNDAWEGTGNTSGAAKLPSKVKVKYGDELERIRKNSNSIHREYLFTMKENPHIVTTIENVLSGKDTCQSLLDARESLKILGEKGMYDDTSHRGLNLKHIISLSSSCNAQLINALSQPKSNDSNSTIIDILQKHKRNLEMVKKLRSRLQSTITEISEENSKLTEQISRSSSFDEKNGERKNEARKHVFEGSATEKYDESLQAIIDGIELSEEKPGRNQSFEMYNFSGSVNNIAPLPTVADEKQLEKDSNDEVSLNLETNYHVRSSPEEESVNVLYRPDDSLVSNSATEFEQEADDGQVDIVADELESSMSFWSLNEI